MSTTKFSIVAFMKGESRNSWILGNFDVTEKYVQTADESRHFSCANIDNAVAKELATSTKTPEGKTELALTAKGRYYVGDNGCTYIVAEDGNSGAPTFKAPQ